MHLRRCRFPGSNPQATEGPLLPRLDLRRHATLLGARERAYKNRTIIDRPPPGDLHPTHIYLYIRRHSHLDSALGADRASLPARAPFRGYRAYRPGNASRRGTGPLIGTARRKRGCYPRQRFAGGYCVLGSYTRTTNSIGGLRPSIHSGSGAVAPKRVTSIHESNRHHNGDQPW